MNRPTALLCAPNSRGHSQPIICGTTRTYQNRPYQDIMNRSHLRTRFTGTIVWIEIVKRNSQIVWFETFKDIMNRSHSRTRFTGTIVWIEIVKRQGDNSLD